MTNELVFSSKLIHVQYFIILSNWIEWHDLIADVFVFRKKGRSRAIHRSESIEESDEDEAPRLIHSISSDHEDDTSHETLDIDSGQSNKSNFNFSNYRTAISLSFL